VGERQDRVRVAPAPELGQRVGADHEHGLPGRDPRADRAQRVDGEGRPGALDLDGIQLEALVARDGAPHPVEPNGRGRQPLLALVRRRARRDEQQPLETELLDHLLRRPQMTQVDRVEGAPEHAEQPRPGHSRSWPSPYSTNFCVVRLSRPIGP
jgi:hypothetical protein